MPRVHRQKAGKDYPAQGIKKGDIYYSWSFYRGPEQKSKTPPRPSQLTQREAYSQAYAAIEGLQDAVALLPEDEPSADDRSALADALQACADELEDAISLADDVINNLADAFPGGCPTMEECEEAKSAMEDAQGEAEALKDRAEEDDWGEVREEALNLEVSL